MERIVINGGRPLHVVEISTGLSLAVIVGVLATTVVASLVSPAGRARARAGETSDVVQT